MSIKDLAELKKRERELLELNNDLDSKQVDFNKEMERIKSGKEAQVYNQQRPYDDEEMNDDYDNSGEDNYNNNYDNDDRAYNASDNDKADGSDDYNDNNNNDDDQDYQGDEDSDEIQERKYNGMIGMTSNERVPSRGKIEVEKKPPKPPSRGGVEDLGDNMLKKIDNVKRNEEMKNQMDYEAQKEAHGEQELIINDQKMLIDEMTEQTDMLRSDIRSRDTQLQELKNKGSSISEESSKYVKQIKDQADKLNDSKKQNTDLKKKIAILEKERHNLNTQFETMIKDKKRVELDLTKKDTRINKLSEDIEKMKVNHRQDKITPKMASGNDDDKGNMKLINENKKLEKQRNELLVAFKKQLKLIDLLKRQKTHLEAAQMLKFTEEQFIQALELGEKLK